MSDADKLLAVCRVVWPDHGFYENKGVVCAHTWPEGGFSFCIVDTSLDDIRRVLLALTPGQRRKFDENLEQAWYQQPEQDDVSDYLMFWFCLTAPTSTILDALHRAVCPE